MSNFTLKRFLENFVSKESGPRGPGFDCTPQGWCLLVEWNAGMVE